MLSFIIRYFVYEYSASDYETRNLIVIKNKIKN